MQTTKATETIKTIKRANWRDAIQDALNELDLKIAEHFPKTTWDYIIFSDLAKISDFKAAQLHNIKISASIYHEMPVEESGRIVIMPRSYSGLLPVMNDEGLMVLDSNNLPVLMMQERLVSYMVVRQSAPFAAPQFRMTLPSYCYLLKLED